jgi:hypothetical protein
MNGPITNFELGKMHHREYEARASKYWGQGVTNDDKRTLSKDHKLAWALIRAGLSILLIVLMLVF